MNRSAASRSFGFCTLAILAITMVGSAQAGPISIAMVTVGDSGNAADANLGFGAWGAVKYVYQIGKYDVTAGQYAAFLNAVAPADTYGLYTSYMANGFPAAGIIQSGNSGSYSYSVVAGHENFPINFITWGDAARFSNWLQNGQPNGAEGPGTTETGAYTLNGATSVAALMAVTRNSGAMWFIPTEDEWYKAAYYKGGGVNAGYWTYPTQSDTAPINTLPDTGNHANIYDSSGTGNGGYTDPNNFLTTVGAFNLSPGPYNTFDQGGDIFQWNETAASPGTRGLRGGSFDTNSSYLSSFQGYFFAPTGENFRLTGFRVASIASVPESSSVILLVIGIVALTVARRRRPRR